jgi:hypothetical protein
MPLSKIPFEARARAGVSPSGIGLSASPKPRLRRAFTRTGLHPFCNPNWKVKRFQGPNVSFLG